jgi:hypothetical protein
MMSFFNLGMTTMLSFCVNVIQNVQFSFFLKKAIVFSMEKKKKTNSIAK